ncbi:protein MODIFIER OF SNC1 1 isoform X2 [Phalaenopsis equestris]|uniref:protein MODIFIER OF SNC1 1 isoform X2 n=1 Tax=Phalaenopsis equestris TaxID=78828 RepID=UPI0009E40F5E|nr:protein MODIFIER OF SNC1 1 isoform X2 [Phalaenopsis equestris]
MASSIQSTERRWTSTRKSGMTVLGKVPKPINLPSQKLENHGLDPNVEIVPKGTLTWGTRPLLAASSAWGSSTLSSPRTDGSVGSPVHANGRPSSGGSGTRPSTGSSERSNEPVALSLGSSSRPSSASGILPSSHMSVAANRPRSADNRPNSSHLSRFAESSVDSIAWGAAGTSEKTADASKKSNFTLTSGDFPSLGSEKSDEPKSQKGQNPNVSASPATALSSSLKGTSKPLLTSGNENPGLALHGNFNSWSADTLPCAGEGPSTRTENWHRDIHNAQPLLDAHMAAQQYGPWHGPAHHSPVVWHGGHEAGVLYRPSFGPPGTYHVDAYYPYVQAGALPNNQAFPRAETISGGVHLKKGEAYRHMPPESYLPHGESGIPVRPGVYPGPVLYETHPSFDNSSEQVGSTAGMPGQYGLHNQNRSENQTPQPWRFHPQPDGPVPVTIIQHEISGQANETQGQYRVLLKQHGNHEEKDASGKEHAAVVSSTAQKGRRTGFSMPEPYSTDQSYKEEEKIEEQHGKVSHRQYPNDLVDQNDRNSLGTCKSAGHNVMKKLDTYQQKAIVKKNASLMEKVEGLNSKTRAVDAHFEGENYPAKEMRSNQSSSSGEGHFAGVGPANSCSASSTSVSGARNLGTSKSNAPTKVMIHESVLESNYSEDGVHSQFHNQKVVLDVKGKGEHHGTLKFGSYGADDANNSLEMDSLEKTSVTIGKSGCLLSIPDSQLSKAGSDDQGSRLILNSVSDRSSLKSVDHDVQHAKLKEMARQRALQLQKEEEERTAEQKAKALAKLAELNERALASSKQASRHAQPLNNDSPNKHNTSGKDEKTTTASGALHGSLSCDSEAKKHPNDANIVKLKDSSDLSLTQSSGTSDPSVQAQVSVGEQSWQLGQESNPEFTTGKSASDLQDNNVSRRKQAWNRRRRSNVDERNQSEKLNNSESGGSTRCASIVNEDASDGLGILNSDPPPVQASKNNRGPKYKNKLNDTKLNSQLPHVAQQEGSSGKVVLDSDGTKTPAKLFEPLSVQENNSNESLRDQDSMDLKAGPNQSGSEPAKITTERATNNWKSQPHRKPTKNGQSDKANAKYIGGETVVWAPVKVVNKDGSSESHKSSAGELTNLSDGKNVQDTRNGAKAKRAEIERYVPKPIAKELSLQGDSHQSSSTVVSASSSADSGKRELASSSAVTGKDVSSTVAKTALISMNTEDNKQSRQGKTHSSWRQRNPGEAPSHEQIEQSSGPSKSVQKTSEHQHSKPSDDEGSNKNPQNELITTSDIVKDHGTTRLKRQQFKEVKVDGTSYAPHSKALQGELPNKKEWQPAAPVDSGDRNSSRNENPNAGSGHMKSLWQPKSQVHSQQYQHGYKGGGGQRATEKLLPSQTIEQQFEYQSGHNKDGDMFQKNSGAREESSEAHRVSSGSRYGMQGHHHTRRGGHLYGHRRGGASVRVNGSYDMVG